MITIAEWLSIARVKLSNSDTPQLDAEVLLAHALKKDRAYLYTWPEYKLLATETSQANLYLERRLAGEPVAYILGFKEFWSLTLNVNHSVLIPRPETELLVEKVLQSKTNDGLKVIDLGTGTGAIILSLLSERPSWQCWACDESEEALKVAEENQIVNNLTGVQFVLSDWFAGIKENDFDLVVSNPPYIDVEDEHLQQGDVRFEPYGALVSEKNGLEDIETIIQQAVFYLKSGGSLWLEHGYSQGASVRKFFLKYNYKKIETFCDLAGHERVTCGEYVHE